MNINNWLKHIEQCHTKVIDMGLERVRSVGDRGDLLSFDCPIVMVGGTNGKGSTVVSLGKLLLAANIKVGLYTSPHLLSFNERIEINGHHVTDSELCQAFAKIESLRSEIPLTYFEFITLAAFFIFKQQACEIIILEVGMGGRLDAVNALNPCLSIVTSIDYDHEEYLGDTLESIAYEKAGIFRPGIPVILGRNISQKTITNELKSNNNIVYRIDQDFDYREVINKTNIKLPQDSVYLALAAYTILSKKYFSLPSIDTMIDCLEGVEMPGRFYQKNINEINVVFDVAHNGHASLWLSGRLNPLKEKGKLIAVWASLKDKKLPSIIAPMKGVMDKWFIGLLKEKRSATLCNLLSALKAEGIKEEDISAFSSIHEAFEGAISMATRGDTIVVFGSFYTVAQVMEKLCTN